MLGHAGGLAFCQRETSQPLPMSVNVLPIF